MLYVFEGGRPTSSTTAAAAAAPGMAGPVRAAAAAAHRRRYQRQQRPQQQQQLVYGTHDNRIGTLMQHATTAIPNHINDFVDHNDDAAVIIPPSNGMVVVADTIATTDIYGTNQVIGKADIVLGKELTPLVSRSDILDDAASMAQFDDDQHHRVDEDNNDERHTRLSHGHGHVNSVVA
jgi:hypothetical protein